MTHEPEIPIIEIREGWIAEDVSTIDECDDAFAYLTAAIVDIERQIDDRARHGSPTHAQKAALRYKKAALQIVTMMRGRIARAEQRAEQASLDATLLQVIRSETASDQMRAWADKARALAATRAARETAP